VRRQHGFSLLEAIVAIALVGIVGAVLFTWAASTQSTLARVSDQNARQEAVLNAIKFMRTVNPMLRAEGRQPIGSYQVRWRAQPLTPEADNVDYPAGVGLYRVALYRTEVVLDRDDAPGWERFEIKQVGFRRVRESTSMLPQR
jgi:prepilin-type N-terminal cleavage/methylation domain-containing protein